MAVTYDAYIGRTFDCNTAALSVAVSALNRKIILEGDASLNDLYDLLDLEPVVLAERVGWSEEIIVRFSASLDKDMNPRLEFHIHPEPQNDIRIGPV